MQFLSGYKTYIGIAISLIGILAKTFGWHVDWLPASQADIEQVFGLILATYGRAVAKPAA